MCEGGDRLCHGRSDDARAMITNQGPCKHMGEASSSHTLSKLRGGNVRLLLLLLHWLRQTKVGFRGHDQEHSGRGTSEGGGVCVAMVGEEAKCSHGGT